MDCTSFSRGLPLSPAPPHPVSRRVHYLDLHHSRLQSCNSITSVLHQQPNDRLRDDAVHQCSSSPSRRRDLLSPFAAGTVSGFLRWILPGFVSESLPSLAEESYSSPDYTITDKVFLEITKCPSISITSREGGRATQGATSNAATYAYSSSLSPFQPMQVSSSSVSSPMYCNDGERLGRIVIGLYGKQVPVTVAHFKAMCNGKAGSSYRGTVIHRILSGQYIMAGKQGFSKEKGEVPPPSKLDQNMETIKSEAFRIPHMRPGTVSLCLSENDDEDQFKLDPDYRNVEFLITTGPGPASQLDNKNIVFGTVLEGLDVVRAASAVPTYKPSEKIRQFNEFASFLGDERASNARSIWNRPLKALYVSNCGEL